MSDILTGTPPDLTYANDLVRQAWMVVWAITSAALVVILGWMGLSFIISEHLGRAQAGWREMIPRLLLGLVAAASSLWWCALVLDVADAVSGFIAYSLNVTPGDMLRSTLSTLMTAVQAGSVGMALLLAALYLVYGFFVLYVLVQMGAAPGPHRPPAGPGPDCPGAVDIAPHVGLGPPLAAALHDDGVQQAIQLIALALGFGFLKEFAAIAPFEPVQDLIWKLLMSLGFIYMATRVPSMLGNAGTFDAWLSTLYFGMNLPGAMVRSARSIGLIAGGAAGGPGGMAVGAMAAGAGLSAAASGLSSAASMATPSAGRGRRRRSPPEQRRVAPTNDDPTGADAVRGHRERKGGGSDVQVGEWRRRNRWRRTNGRRPGEETPGSQDREEKTNGRPDSDHIEPGGNPAGHRGGGGRRLLHLRRVPIT